MIDFRYHLVSIVSIFLALAVGIVLGAGPLKEDIGNRLTSELTSLRQDKATLRSQLDAAQRGADARDSYAAAVAPVLTRGTLAGRTVAIVVAPGADSGLVKNTTAALAAAGAKVGSTVTLDDSWTDPTKRTFRNKLANDLASLIKVPAGANGADQLPSSILAGAILGASDQATNRIDPSAAQVLDALKEGKLLQYSPDQIAPSSGVVLIGAAVAGKDGKDAENTKARLAGYVQLARALDGAGSGGVVISATNDGAPRKSSDLVAAVRASSDAVKDVSTVDDADLPMGQSTTVLALAQQYAGAAGQYGMADDAKAVTPAPAGKQ